MLTLTAKNCFSLILLLAVFIVGANTLSAQTPSTFTYQGRLTDNNGAANGQYDLTFALYDVASGGTPLFNVLYVPLVIEDVQVTDGVFTVQLTFNSGSFFFKSTQAKYLEIGVRPGASTGGFTTLLPRQPFTAAPYAMQSQNADSLGGAPASQFIQEGDARLTDGRAPNAGSGNYVQNTTTQQSGANFNVGGDGTAGGTLSGNIVRATTQFNIGANRVLSIDGNQGTFVGNSAGLVNSGPINTFVGHFAGASNTTGGSNSFFGSQAGFANTTGGSNSIFGAYAGVENTTGISNSFFGTAAGSSNTSGSTNAFFGASTGQFNVGGGNNSFFGGGAGANNVSGNFNTFLGSYAGVGNTTGVGNSYVGYEAGKNVTTGQGNTIVGIQSGANLTTENFNTIVGAGADVSAGATNATAIGVGALATSSNSVVLGTNIATVRIPGNLNVTGTMTANGSALTNLNAGNITAGTLNNARLGTVPTANGGTGLSATGSAGNFLRSDGSVWTSAALSVADIPNLAGSYIQNGTAPQATSNFNVSGNGTAGGTLNGNVVSATTQFNLGGNRVLSVHLAQSNTFVGVGSGLANTVGGGNSFFGNNSGTGNTIGNSNSFFGDESGHANTEGNDNAFFGEFSGKLNQTGSFNSFFGSHVGDSNLTGSSNAFFGHDAGESNTNGQGNAFFGREAGAENTSGGTNTFIGTGAGSTNTTGNDNTYIGASARGSVGLTNATAIGAYSNVTANNTMVLGTGVVTVQVPGNLNVTGTFNANGSALTNLNAGNITTGTLNNSRLGVVPTANGGTGVNATGAAGNVLRSNGSVWTSSPLSASDIPSLAASYIQNNLSQQSASNFNISGTGFANIFAATTQFNINADRVLFTDASFNTFAGANAGTGTTGGRNSFFGESAGEENLAGSSNSFFGNNAGQANLTGSDNSFFGKGAGDSNTAGSRNNFFGVAAGGATISGNNNSFFGDGAGLLNKASDNAFFGRMAGRNNSDGINNTVVGTNAGESNTTENNNTFLGYNAEGAAGITNATAIGANASVTTSNTVILGSISATNGAAASAKVGIGTTAPTERLTVQTPSSNFGFVHTDGVITVGSYVGGSGVGGWYGTKSNHPLFFFTNNSAAQVTLETSGEVGIGTTTPKEKLEVSGGDILVGTAGQGMILKSPNGGTCAKLTLSNAGALVTTVVACP